MDMLLKLPNYKQAIIREHTMKLLNRLACFNPAFLIPSLRKILIQLLKELRHAPVPPKDFDLRVQSTCLFVQLIRTKQDLVDPYLLPMLQIIIPNILHGSHHTSLASATIGILGALDSYKYNLCLPGSGLHANDEDMFSKASDITYKEKTKVMAHGGGRNNASRLGIPIDTAAFERTDHTMDVLDDKQLFAMLGGM
ncbi:unnamed protein product [Albugo candida]|uniref:Uncharacterized protein n=1 Tax=Albugo candida TaxID=65357 RepID=A0A024GVZ9_9STRA|nr:unnamed protein product [Albugo candida]|eukprot:CCI50777.1 unnamed protein product [Albugo candida]